MNIKHKKSLIICSLVLCIALAVSVMSLGFASWHTDITASGNIAAESNWEVNATKADINLSTGAHVSQSLVRTGVASDYVIAPYVSSGNWLNADQWDLLGTQTDEVLPSTTHMYAIDTTKYDISDVTKLDRNEIAADESTLIISDHLHKYYSSVYDYKIDDNSKYDEWRTIVVNGLLRDTTALLKEKFPENYQDYALVSLVGLPIPNWGTYFCFADFSSATISDNATKVDFADVNFTLPGAWAQYTITVANNGTADANLADAIIQLETESDQLVLDKPDLSDETLKPGESCTISFVVKVPETITDDLNATGKLTVKLPYNQLVVEDAPAASHTH